MKNTTLTEIETLGLKSKFNFADGHAYHDLAPSQIDILGRLRGIWESSAQRKVKEAERLYFDAFLNLAESSSLMDYPYFRICPTASNSIDTVAAWLAHQKMSTALSHPTFDNLFLILKRRGVTVAPLEESKLQEGITAFFQKLESDAIFLVNPNNPTGTTLSQAQFTEIVQFCVSHGKTLLLDNTFRFFVASDYDQYQVLLDSGVSFISIEDTGKVWPTQDMKASLLIYSKDVATNLELIYEEIYLCVSNFSLGILTEFVKDAKQRGLAESVWLEVKKRRRLFREAINGTAFEIDPISVHSDLSVEWVRIHALFASDLEAAEYFKKMDLILLPGRHFFWNGYPGKIPCQNIRFSLLKPKAHFFNALEALTLGLRKAVKETRNESRCISSWAFQR